MSPGNHYPANPLLYFLHLSYHYPHHLIIGSSLNYLFPLTFNLHESRTQGSLLCPSTQPSAGHIVNPPLSVCWVHLLPSGAGVFGRPPKHVLAAVSVVTKPLYFSSQSQIVVNDIKSMRTRCSIFQTGCSDWNPTLKEVSDQEPTKPTTWLPSHLHSRLLACASLKHSLTPQSKYLPISEHANPLARPSSTASIKSAFQETLGDLLSPSRVTCEGRKGIVIILSIFHLNNLGHDLMESLSPPAPFLPRMTWRPGHLAAEVRWAAENPPTSLRLCLRESRNRDELLLAV